MVAQATPDAPAEPLELLKVTEAAKRYPIGVKRLYALIHAGQIPAVVIKNPRRDRILVRPQAVEDWLRAQETAASG